MPNSTMPTAGELLLVWFLVAIVIFAIQVLVTRWIFKVNRVIGLLEEISEKMDALPKKPVEWDDIMPPEKKEEDSAKRYGPKS